MNQLIKISEDGKITARELYEFLELNKSQFSRWAKQNIENNIYYTECIDWWGG
ncbi:antA/AntB antirepressor family protein [Anaerosinus massiliensis]|uniref:antA/AntB antirepressor family protein n=1 Tax=Massilibacillus massiliensis TaxID=1806837 RepID=UPI000DA61890|nr:antA/AntB antirepressor family protein [Massilibacillus massiliensis]